MRALSCFRPLSWSLCLGVPLAVFGCGGAVSTQDEPPHLEQNPDAPLPADASGGTGGNSTQGDGGSASGGDAAGGGSSSGGTGQAGTGGGLSSEADPSWPWSSHTYTPSPPFELGDPELPISDEALNVQPSDCTPPCAVSTTLDPGQWFDDTTLDAQLVIDLDTSTATLSSTYASGPTDTLNLGFTQEADQQYGNGSWTSNYTGQVYTQNFDYEPGTYSIHSEELVMTELMKYPTGQTAQVVYSFTDSGVRIHSVRVPSCEADGDGVCENASDCPAVHTGEVALLSAPCQSCYEQVAACSAERCPDDCPGGVGNACLNCQIDQGCHDDFMSCTGLDYLPPNSMKFPEWGYD